MLKYQQAEAEIDESVRTREGIMHQITTEMATLAPVAASGVFDTRSEVRLYRASVGSDETRDRLHHLQRVLLTDAG